MAEVKKARLFLRRGTDVDRQDTVLCQGELGYSTDAFRVFVGDGSTEGGKTLGLMAFVSAGANFQTNLTVASGSGLAHFGDLAIFPSSNYTAADGTARVIDTSHATTVMILTGTNPATSSHWVNVNNNIPFGNISVSADDISGNYVSGGIISAPITLSGGPITLGGDDTNETLVLSGVGLKAEGGVGVPTGKIYPLGITGTGAVTALTGVDSFTNRSIEHRTYYIYTMRQTGVDISNALNTHYDSNTFTAGGTTPTLNFMGDFLSNKWPTSKIGDTVQLLWAGSGSARKIKSYLPIFITDWLVVNLQRTGTNANQWTIMDWVMTSSSRSYTTRSVHNTIVAGSESN
jgi:hypothetical protein